jgi:hypothetical protein
MYRNHRFTFALLGLLAGLALAGCSQPLEAQPETGPAAVDPDPSTGLSRITLTERAAQRIGIETAAVTEAATTRTLVAQGEVIASGAAGAVEVLVRLNASDFERIDHASVARILPAPDGDAGAVVAHVTKEEQAAGYGDGAVYYAPDGQAGLEAGQRPRVEMLLRGSSGSRLSVPYPAILYDDAGATWVYTSPEPLVFVRAKVTVDYVDGETAVLTDGPPAGMRVVTVGVSELFGTEVGVEE